MQEIRENSKFFKSGNSFGLRLTKSDKEKMHAHHLDERAFFRKYKNAVSNL